MTQPIVQPTLAAVAAGERRSRSSNRTIAVPGLADDPLWYKDAIIYQVHVRAFQDSDGDGSGDFRGLTSRLDYLQDLGVTAIWLLPFYPSPLRDDGYDIADFTSVNPTYGTLADFKAFLREAHHRGLRVITELVLNHTSDQHPWFQRARRARPGSQWRDLYVWSDTPDRYTGARIIFQDFESSNWSWDSVANAYFWHRFYGHQPDLNFDSPYVRQAMLRVLDYWLDMGVDGLRLDAVPYLYEREGTSCENLPETHEYLRMVRRHMDERYRNRMLLAEANQWPEDALQYFGEDDECHMAFHFPLMPRLFMAIRMEDRYPIVEIMQQTPSIPRNSQWALFLRNHDELTLEMVTDEERDYMRRVYAADPRARINLGIRRRLAPLLGNNRRRLELMKGLLFSLPGTAVLYYGDEIGMGDNIYLGDRNGVRTPMQWSPDRNAGFSRANPQQLYFPVIIDPEYHYETVNVEAQQDNPNSLLWWMKRLIALRKRYRAFGRGSLEFINTENHKVLAFVRQYEDERILVVANLSRFVQGTEIDLSAFRGMRPLELFGHSQFPTIGEGPYFLSLGPHAFFWFALEPPTAEYPAALQPSPEPSLIAVLDGWTEVFEGRGRTALEAALPRFLLQRRWFGAKARTISTTRLVDAVPIDPGDELRGVLALIRVEYVEGEPDLYGVPLAFATGEHAERLVAEQQQAVVARLDLREQGTMGVLHDALVEAAFGAQLLDAMVRKRRFRGRAGEVTGFGNSDLRSSVASAESLAPVLLRAEQSNSSIAFGSSLVMKAFRRLHPGPNPDLEIGRYLTDRSFAYTPPVAGWLEYRAPRAEPVTLAILHRFVQNEGDGWQHTLDALGQYNERMLSRSASDQRPEVAAGSLLALARSETPPEAVAAIGAYLGVARLLGERTAQMHLALAAATEDPAFRPEPLTPLAQRSMYQSMRSLALQTFRLLRRKVRDMPPAIHEPARALLDREQELMDRFARLMQNPVTAMRTRTHGDYHLGQVLFTGKDFMIIDFEGEPARPLGERRLKRSPLRDVAGMLDSFHYAAFAALREGQSAGFIRPEDVEPLRPWADYWVRWVRASFLSAYLRTAGDAPFLPRDPSEIETLLESHLLEKAVYDVTYELNNRPDWAGIPVGGILQFLDRTI